MKKQNRLLLNIFFYCCMLCACTCFVMQAQFSPLLDTHCQVLMDDKEGTTWNSSYMWYPGQLAAHKQAMLRKGSNYRCVNVDYPGTYMEAVDHAIFRKKIEWDGLGYPQLGVPLSVKEVLPKPSGTR